VARGHVADRLKREPEKLGSGSSADSTRYISSSLAQPVPYDGAIRFRDLPLDFGHALRVLLLSARPSLVRGLRVRAARVHGMMTVI
jgi:hypothetical protein